MDKHWYIFSQDHHLGPFDPEEILGMLAKGDISRKSLLWKEGLSKWIQLEKIPELKKSLEEDSGPPEIPFENFPPDIPPPPELGEERDLVLKEESEKISDLLPPVPEVPDEEDEVEEEEESVSPPDIPLPEAPLINEKVDQTKLQKRAFRRKKKKKWKVDYYKSIEKKDEALVSDYKEQHKVPLNIKILLFVFCLLLGGIFVKSSFEFSTTHPTFEELYAKDYERLSSVTRSISKNKVLMGFALGKKNKKIWVSSNKKGPYSLIFQFISMKEKILGSGKVVFSGQCTLTKHWCQLDKIAINEGKNFSQGYYKVKVRAFYQSEKEDQFRKLLQFLNLSSLTGLKKTPFLYENQVLMYQGIPSQFLKELKKRKRETYDKNVQFFREKIEEFKTLKALSQKMMEIYGEVLGQIKIGRKISRFEGKYAVVIGPLLRGLILDNKDNFEKTKEKEIKKSKYYKKVFNYGRRIGNLASDMVVVTSKSKKITRRSRTRLLKLFNSKVKQVISLGNKNIGELERLISFSKDE